MANDDAISHVPITTSQMPTTNASIQMDSNGDAITTMPAMRLITPTKMDHPRPGSIGSLIAETAGGDAAEDEPDADPDGQQQNRVTEMAKGQHSQDE